MENIMVQNSPDNSEQPEAWYRQFWPWFLMLFPATAVVAGIITIILAVQSDDGLVDDDYFKSGLAINKHLDKSQHAQELGLTANIQLDKLTQGVTLQLSGDLSNKPKRLLLTLLHPTRSQLDHKAILYLNPDKQAYTGRLPEITSTEWHIILSPEDNSWRLTGRASLKEQHNWYLDTK